MPSLLDPISFQGGLLGDAVTDPAPQARGLLGDSFDDPRTMAVFAAVRGLLGGRRALDGIAAGVGSYGESMQAARQQAANDQLRRLQMAQAVMSLRQAQRQDARQQQLDALPAQFARSPAQTALAGGGGPTLQNAKALETAAPSFDFNGYAKALAGVDPMSSLQMQAALRKDNTPVKVAPGEALWDANTQRQLFINPKTQDPTAEIQQYNLAVQQGYRGTIRDYELEKKRAGAQAITVDMRGDNAYSTAQGKEYSDLMAGINKAGFTAPAQLRKLERLSNLLEGVEGGKLAPTGLDVVSALNSYGVKIDPRIGNKEAAQALARELAGGLRQPGTGPMTDKDFDNFLTQIPDLSKSAAGRKQITQTMQAALNRDIKVSQLARQYERRHGRIDGGFLDQVAAFIAENPVVAPPAGWVVQR